MACEDPHHRQITSLIDDHPLLPTEELKFRVIQFAELHLRHEEAGDDAPPLAEVTLCVLISLLREILMQRKQHGPPETPTVEWHFDAHKPVN